MTIEAMKQALEALKEFCEHGTMLKPIERRDALRQAIAEAERQQRPWVGLTAQERDAINEQVFGAVPHHVAFAHAIEAKLRSKNHA